MQAEDTTTGEEPRVWVGCLAAYNSGRLHGEWVEVTPDAEEMQDAIDRVLKSSPIPRAEEHFMADCENLPGHLTYEGAHAEELAAYAEALETADLNGIPAYIFRAACDDIGQTADPDEIRIIQGREWLHDWEDVALAYCEEVGEEGLFGEAIPESLAGFIDWERVGRDYFMHDGWTLADGIAWKVD
jgi:antirestriction protein